MSKADLARGGSMVVVFIIYLYTRFLESLQPCGGSALGHHCGCLILT